MSHPVRVRPGSTAPARRRVYRPAPDRLEGRSQPNGLVGLGLAGGLASDLLPEGLRGQTADVVRRPAFFDADSSNRDKSPVAQRIHGGTSGHAVPSEPPAAPPSRTADPGEESLLAATTNGEVTALAAADVGGVVPLAATGTGTVVTPVSSREQDYARAVTLQTVGGQTKIVTAGNAQTNSSSRSFALVRYNENGSLDTNFGGSGKVTGPTGQAWAVAIQGDGKILAAGSSPSSGKMTATDNFTLARYHPNGTLDTTFGNKGVAIASLSASNDEIGAIHLLPDGKILAAGEAVVNGYYQFALARFTPGGRLDTTFGVGGYVTTDVGANTDQGMAMIVQGDGGPGTTITVVGASRRWFGDTSSYDVSLVRYDANGTLDPSFGIGGKVITEFGTVAEPDRAAGGAMSVAVQEGGKLLVGAVLHASSMYQDFGVLRYNSDGSLDTTFGPDGTGYVRTNLGAGGVAAADVVRTVLVQPTTGQIVAVGRSEPVSGGASTYSMAAVRYSADGILDTSFGPDGTGIAKTASSGAYAEAAVAYPDGRIVAAGGMNTSNGTDTAVTRFTVDGILDTSFSG